MLEDDLPGSGEERERRTLFRWTYSNAHDLPNIFGFSLPRGWWCGFFLQRRFIFGDDQDGDVDFIAGPTRYSFAADEWADRVKACVGTVPFGLEEGAAHIKAGEDGCIVWPPELEEVVACEMKASYFKDGRWKRTHTGDNARKGTLKQLRRLKDQGISRVALMHFGVMNISTERSDTWDAEDELMTEALCVFPTGASPETTEAFGYFVSAMAMGPDRSAQHHPLTSLRPAELLQPPSVHPWHGQLLERLAALGKPSYLTAVVHECRSPTCLKWRIGRHVDPRRNPCDCGAPAEPPLQTTT